jgi:hypothetical protein
MLLSDAVTCTLKGLPTLVVGVPWMTPPLTMFKPAGSCVADHV